MPEMSEKRHDPVGGNGNCSAQKLEHLREKSEQELLDELSEKTGMPAPKPLASLRDKEIRFTQTVEKDHMVDAVLSMLE